MNEDTPFKIKLNVFYSCLCSLLLYISEAWGDITSIQKQILEIERKAIKALIGVKLGTSEDIICTEINRADIIAVIKDRQHKFINKIIKLNSEETVAKGIYNLYKNHHNQNEGILYYYENLLPNNRTKTLEVKRNMIRNSDATMSKRYTELIGIPESDLFLYNSLANDIDRKDNISLEAVTSQLIYRNWQIQTAKNTDRA